MKIVIGSIVLLMAVLTGLSFTGKKSNTSSGLHPEPSVSRKHEASATPRVPIDVLGTLHAPTPDTAANESTVETIREMIGQALAKKYNRPADAFALAVDLIEDRHAKGTVAFTGEPENRSWYGVLDQGEWISVADGMDELDCATADTYDFPNTIVPVCTDSQNGNASVRR